MGAYKKKGGRFYMIFGGVILRVMVVVAAVWLFLYVISLIQCVDYGFEYYFSVKGGNGRIFVELDEEHTESSPVYLLCGKTSYSHDVTFTALPDEGYKVKEWTCNGKVVDGNYTNTYNTGRIKCENYKMYVTVEFEAIPDLS